MNSARAILLVEGDEELGRQIADQLGAAGFDVEWLRSGADALARDPGGYALVILDLRLPAVHGLDVVRHVRRRSDVPVLVLSARSDTRFKVRALEVGADDFIARPFRPEELLAHVRARLRRPVVLRAERIVVGELSLDLGARRAHAADRELDLTRVEFDLLALLAGRRGATVQRAWLADQVLDPALEGTDRTLDVHVSRLRKKLGALAGNLTTVWGVGYRWDVRRG